VKTKPTVYVETSVLSYYTARPARDVILRAHQEITGRWWKSAAQRFLLVVSEITILEAREGDPEAADKRLRAIAGWPVLALTKWCDEVGKRYLEESLLPECAVRDALHLAIASVHAVDYLVTRNCTHIANAMIRRNLAETNQALRIVTPIICTPEELREV
jgi:predicted nucleic acid-binding protein